MNKYCDDRFSSPDCHACAECGRTSFKRWVYPINIKLAKSGYKRFYECPQCGGTMLPTWTVSTTYFQKSTISLTNIYNFQIRFASF